MDKTPRVGDIVKVSWIDSNGRSRWHPKSEGSELRPSTCRTVGEVLSEGKDFLTVASSLSDTYEDYLELVDNVMSIPKSSIKLIEVLEPRTKL